MSKKSNLFRLIMSLALVATLLLGMTLPAMASWTSDNVISSDTGLSLAVTKKLTMPEGTITPTKTFTFKLVPQPNATESTAVIADYPHYNSASNSTGEFTTTITIDSTSKVIDRNGDNKVVVGQSPSLFDDSMWKGAGTYVFKVTESLTSVTNGDRIEEITDGNGVLLEKYEYSKAEYDLIVLVRQNAAGDYYIASVACRVIKNEDGSNNNTFVKRDPTEDGKTEIYTDEEPIKYSDMYFTNNYIKYAGDNGGDPDKLTNGSLSIFKHVDGLDGDTNKPFQFTFTISQNADFLALDTNTKYRARVYDANGIVTPLTNDNFVANTGTTLVQRPGKSDYIEFTAGTAAQIQLKHGQELRIFDRVVGSPFDVTEKDYSDLFYSTEIDLTLAGATNGLGATLETGPQVLKDPVNKVEFKNTSNASPLTGVSMNDLPYVVLLALVVGAGVAFMVIKYRKAAQQSAE